VRVSGSHPKTGIAQNKSSKSGKFSAPKIRPSAHHDSPPIHHKFTIEKPRPAPHFLQKPQQKPRKLPPKKLRGFEAQIHPRLK
jgi:hypothetical protein